MDLTRAVRGPMPTKDGGTCYVVGVEHLSPGAAHIVTRTIRGRRPDTVVIELDCQRARLLGIVPNSPPLQSPSPSLPCVVEAYPQRGGFPGIPALLYVWATSSVIAGISDLYEGCSYGGEFVAAAAAAEEAGSATLILGDRDLLLTLQRAAADLSWREVALDMLPTALGGMHLPPGYHLPLDSAARLLWAAFTLGGGKRGGWGAVADVLEEVSADAFASAPDFASSQAGRTLATWNSLISGVIREGAITRVGKNALGATLQQLLFSLDASPELMANVPRALTEERDVLLARAMYNAPGKTVVAVVGRGHLQGIVKCWGPALGEDAREGQGEGEGGGWGLGVLAQRRPSTTPSTLSQPPAVATLLRPPPFSSLVAYGAPAVTLGAALWGGAALWRRRLRGGWRTRAAFAVYAAGMAGAGGGALLLAQRVTQVRDRIRLALLEAAEDEV